MRAMSKDPLMNDNHHISNSKGSLGLHAHEKICSWRAALKISNRYFRTWNNPLTMRCFLSWSNLQCNNYAMTSIRTIESLCDDLHKNYPLLQQFLMQSIIKPHIIIKDVNNNQISLLLLLMWTIIISYVVIKDVTNHQIT